MVSTRATAGASIVARGAGGRRHCLVWRSGRRSRGRLPGGQCPRQCTWHHPSRASAGPATPGFRAEAERRRSTPRALRTMTWPCSWSKAAGSFGTRRTGSRAGCRVTGPHWAARCATVIEIRSGRRDPAPRLLVVSELPAGRSSAIPAGRPTSARSTPGPLRWPHCAIMPMPNCGIHPVRAGSTADITPRPLVTDHGAGSCLKIDVTSGLTPTEAQKSAAEWGTAGPQSHNWPEPDNKEPPRHLARINVNVVANASADVFVCRTGDVNRRIIRTFARCAEV